MNKRHWPSCSPYCDGQRYMLQEGAHVIDFYIRDDWSGTVDSALEWMKTVIEARGVEVLRYWPEPEYRPPTFLWLNPLTQEPWQGKLPTFEKNPPYLFLVKEKTQ